MRNFKKPPSIQKQLNDKPSVKIKDLSLYEIVVKGREFESIISEVSKQPFNVNPVNDIRRCLTDIENNRGRPCIMYIANVVNSNVKASISIEYSDDLPFSELISTIPDHIREIDVMIVTPGGSGDQAAKFVEKLRSRFDYVGVILPDMAMSAGTIFAMSGDDIVMSQNSYIGPIDPQVLNKEGRYVPAQAVNILLSEIQKKGEDRLKRGQQPDWTDLQILRQLDAKDIGASINASNFSIELVENYLFNYKFKNWVLHSNGDVVEPFEKQQRAKEIASQLCDHSLWKSHGRGITRDQAESVCRLKITKTENIGLDEIVKKLWAIIYWSFENTSIYKMFLSNYYALIRHDKTLMNPEN